MLELARFAFSRSCTAGTEVPMLPGCIALPHRTTATGRRFAAEATAGLVTLAEAACLRELQLHLESGRAIVGVHTEIQHVGIAVQGIQLYVHGRAQPCGENETAFDVVIDDPHDRVATARVVVYVAEARRRPDAPRQRPARQAAAEPESEAESEAERETEGACSY